MCGGPDSVGCDLCCMLGIILSEVNMGVIITVSTCCLSSLR